MSNVVNGKDVSVETLVGVDWIATACAVSCSFEFENELIGKTDVNAGLFRKKRVRISDTRGSLQGLTTINNNSKLSIFYYLQEGVRRTELTMRFVFTDESNDVRYVQGVFLVKTIGLTGESSGFSEFDLQLEGTGNIIIGTVNEISDTTCPELFSDTWTMAEGETTISGLGQEGRSFAGTEVLEVDREGMQYDYTSGTPGNRQHGYDGTEISFQNEAAEGGEKVFVVWKAIES